MKIEFTVNTSGNGRVVGDTVIQPAKIFNVGEFPDKEFDLSKPELSQVPAMFDGPIAMNNEHKSSPAHGILGKILQGELGGIQNVWENGADLFGNIAIPKWLYDAAQKKNIPLKVSAEFDRATKKLDGCAWTEFPRIADAGVLKATFSLSDDDVESLPVEFKTFDTAQRNADAKSGAALPDGSYPIKSEKDVKDAVADFGRGGSKPEVKAHIKKRAKALGCTDCLPDDWKSGDPAKMSEGELKEFMEVHACFTSAVAEKKTNPEAIYMATDLLALFAGKRHNTPEGQSCLQDIHDRTGRMGAVCDPKNTANMSSKHEATAIQQIHDITVKHDAQCSKGDAPSWMRSMYSQTPAPTGTGGVPASPTKGKPMPFTEKLKALFGKAGVPEAEIEDALKDVKDADFSTAPVEDPRVKQLESQVAQFAADKRAMQADAFYRELLTAKKVLPAQEVAVKALFSQALSDDSTNVTKVCFSDDGNGNKKEGSRIDALKAVFDAQPAHMLFSETMKDEELSQLIASFNQQTTAQFGDKDKKSDPKSVDRLLSTTYEGRQVLADRAKNGNGNSGGGKN